MPETAPPERRLFEAPVVPDAPLQRRAVESRNPATGEVWQTYDPATPGQVAATVARARAAQPAWGASPVANRTALLRRFHELLFRRRMEIAEALTRENGKPTAEALSNEVAVVLDVARYYAAQAPGFLRAPWRAAASLAMARKRVRIVKEPYGVVGVISPWNYPLMLASAQILPALVTGNAVLLKPSEFTPGIGALIGDLLREAGLPSDLFAVLQGDGATGAALCAADVDKVFFTGSVGAGRAVAARCAERLVPCSLELGGSDAAIVLADADVQHAASGIAWGRFSNGGQTCVAPKRVFVEAPAYDAFVAAMRTTVGALRMGPGADPSSDVGPMIHIAAVRTITSQRDDAVARGAQSVEGATAGPAVSADGSAFFSPTVLLDTPAGARALTEETFGPLLPVMRVRDADEAIALANDSPFGLSASVWSRDTARAARIAERLSAGSVSINDAIVTAGMADVPHGGVKTSGIGSAHGLEGLAACVRPKAIVADRFASWRQAWWFGYSAEHLAGIDAFLRVSHSSSLLDRARAVPGFLKLLLAPKRPL